MSAPADTWTGVTPGVPFPCRDCGKTIAGRRTAVKLGLPQHGGDGRCEACRGKHQRQLVRRAVTRTSQPVVRKPKPVVKPKPKPLELPPRPDPEPRMLPPAGSWLKRAACIGADPTWFDEVVSREREIPQQAQDAARKYCAGCPVIVDCNREAETEKRTGLWAGIYRTVRRYAYERHPLLGPGAR